MSFEVYCKSKSTVSSTAQWQLLFEQNVAFNTKDKNAIKIM